MSHIPLWKETRSNLLSQPYSPLIKTNLTSLCFVLTLGLPLHHKDKSHDQKSEFKIQHPITNLLYQNKKHCNSNHPLKKNLNIPI